MNGSQRSCGSSFFHLSFVRLAGQGSAFYSSCIHSSSTWRPLGPARLCTRPMRSRRYTTKPKIQPLLLLFLVLYVMRSQCLLARQEQTRLAPCQSRIASPFQNLVHELGLLQKPRLLSVLARVSFRHLSNSFLPLAASALSRMETTWSMTPKLNRALLNLPWIPEARHPGRNAARMRLLVAMYPGIHESNFSLSMHQKNRGREACQTRVFYLTIERIWSRKAWTSLCLLQRFGALDSLPHSTSAPSRIHKRKHCGKSQRYHSAVTPHRPPSDVPTQHH